MEKVIPLKRKTRRARFSSAPRVTEAREDIKDAYKTYQTDTNERNRTNYNRVKKKLEDAYNLVTEEDLTK